jgi:ribonuclease P protein component
MLSSPKDFAALQGGRSIRADQLLTIRYRWTGLDQTRFGFAVSRRLGGAVIRNRLRRRLRESLRALAPFLAPGWDVLIVARSGLGLTGHRALTAAVESSLRRAGILQHAESA